MVMPDMRTTSVPIPGESTVSAIGSGRRRWSLIGVALLVLVSLVAGCSGDDSGDDNGSSTTDSTQTDEAQPIATSVPGIDLPRYVDDGSIRLTMSSEQPLFLYNAYVADGPEVIDEVVAKWPEDLLGYLGFQIVFPAHEMIPEADRAAALDEFLERTDAAQIPALVQTAVFLGETGPNGEELDAAFAEHPSLVGVSIAEFSVDVQTVITGLTDVQKDMIAERIDIAVRNDALFLWADMGYLTPQVFVNAGADERLYQLMSDNSENIVVQAKQNGAGSRFTSMAAAFGFYAAGLAGNWGINSEDWLWYEASLERLFGPQVTGGMTAAGMTRSPYLNRARRTYPEALYGTEMLVAASAGATVFSIEAPERGTVDPTIEGDSPAGPNVVFPTLRRLIADRLIPDRETVIARTPVAYQPAEATPAALANDLAFSGLYGPEACADVDVTSCAQRQWLPSTGRYGLIPIIPALSPPEVAARFKAVMEPLGGTDDERRAALDPYFPEPAATGTSWIVQGGPADTWFFANPNENQDVTTDATIPLSDDIELNAVIGPHTFAVVDDRDGVSMLISNFRTDSDVLWDQAPTEEELEEIGLDEVPTAPVAETVLEFSLAEGSKRPRVRHEGGEVEEVWDAATSSLTLTITHRGPVAIRLD